MNELDQVVFLIADAKIIESPIRDLDGYIDETTTPFGIGPRYHIRDQELWSWGHGGNNPRMVSEHGSPAEALDALEKTFAYDFWNHPEFLAFTTREDATAFLLDA